MQSSGVSLNPEQQLSCRRIFQENTYAHACIELLSTKLMENGIVVRRGKTESPRDLQDLVEKDALKRTGERRHTRYWLKLNQTL